MNAKIVMIITKGKKKKKDAILFGLCVNIAKLITVSCFWDFIACKYERHAIIFKRYVFFLHFLF